MFYRAKYPRSPLKRSFCWTSSTFLMKFVCPTFTFGNPYIGESAGILLSDQELRGKVAKIVSNITNGFSHRLNSLIPGV